MSDVLEDICAEKRVHIDGCKAEVPLEILERIIKSQKPPRGFAAKLEQAAAERGFGLITELKRASPSRGARCSAIRSRRKVTAGTRR